MRFNTAAIAFLAALSYLMSASTTMALDPRIEQVYESASLDSCPHRGSAGANHGGGFITSDYFFVVFSCELSDSVLIGAPLERDALYDKIINIQFENCFVVHQESYLDLGFNPGGPNGDIFYSIWHYTVPQSQYGTTESAKGIGSFNSNTDPPSFSANQEILKQTFIDLQVPHPPTQSQSSCAATEFFEGLFGIDWHPTVQDAALGHRQMYGTSFYSFARMSWQNTGGQYAPTGAEILCDLSEYPGGFVFVPSGTRKGSAIINIWDEGRIDILELSDDGYCIDAGTGQAATSGTAEPSVIPFVPSGSVAGPWGMIIDPVTNDFFSTSWEGDDEIVHFSVFAPGLNPNKVVENISERVSQITILANVGGVRRRRNLRELGKKKKDKLTLRDLIDAFWDWYYTVNPPTTPPSATDITSSVNTAIEEGDADAVQEAIVGPVETITSNSLSTAIDSGDFTQFAAEMEETRTAITDSISAMKDIAPPQNVAAIEAEEAVINELLDALVNIQNIEG